MSLVAAIRAILKQEVKPTILRGKVKSYDANTNTCVVDLLDGPDLLDVKIKAVANELANGLVIEPKVNSTVLLAAINGRIEDAIILKYDEVENIQLNASTLIKINGESLGGLVKSQVVAATDNTIKGDLNSLKQKVAQWLPTPQDGGAGLKAILTTWASQQLTDKAKADYESKTTKHGE